MPQGTGESEGARATGSPSAVPGTDAAEDLGPRGLRRGQQHAASSEGPLYLSPTSLDRLATCEARFVYHLAGKQEEGPRSDALILGSVYHKLVQAWRQGGDVEAAYQEALVEDDVLLEFEEPEPYLRARSLAAGYAAEYHDDGYVTVETELPFDLALDPANPGVRVRGYLDGLLKKGAGYWVHELKTMGRWNRMDSIAFEPQPQTYLWAARQLGYDVAGVVWDGASTYRYKGGVGAHCFRRTLLLADQGLLDWTLANYRRAAARVAAIVKDPELAVRSVGEACTKWGRPCPAMALCHPQREFQ